MHTAVVLVHDRDLTLGTRDIGTLASELRSRGFELDVYSFESVHFAGLATSPPALGDASMLLVMGSPDAAYDDALPWLEDEISYVSDAVTEGIPILGVCFGGQLLARVLGGTVRRAETAEHGFTTITTADASIVTAGPWMEFHSDTFTLPPGATQVAHTDAAVQAFTFGPHLGLQFHPEIDLASYTAWAAAWKRDGLLTGMAAQGIDVDGIREEIERSQEASRSACARLVGSFLARSGAASPSLSV